MAEKTLEERVAERRRILAEQKANETLENDKEARARGFTTPSNKKAATAPKKPIAEPIDTIPMSVNPPIAQIDNTSAQLVATESERGNPLLTAASFLAPLTVDEIETHGFSRKPILAAKATGDVAMAAVPATKAVTLGAKAIKPASQLARFGEYAYASPQLRNRMIGQATGNAIDNTLATGAEMLFDNREHSLSEIPASILIGGATGGAGGVKSLGNTIEFRQNLYKKTKAKEGSKKQQNYDMLDRFNEGDNSNLDQAADLIARLPLNDSKLPMTWDQIGKHYDNKIAEGLAEARTRADAAKAARLAKTEKMSNATAIDAQGNQIGKITFVPEGETVPLRKPVFANDAEEKTFYRNINAFIEKNSLGKVEQGAKGMELRLNPEMTSMDVEETLRMMRKGDFTTKGQKDWREELRMSLRDARGGDNPEPGSFGEAMNSLEKLRRESQILGNAAGGFGFGTPPNRFGIFSSFNKESRPQLGLYDIDLDVIPRNITQAATNLGNRSEEVESYLNAFFNAVSQFGEASPQVQAIYDKMDIGEKNMAIQGLNAMQDNAIPQSTGAR